MEEPRGRSGIDAHRSITNRPAKRSHGIGAALRIALLASLTAPALTLAIHPGSPADLEAARSSPGFGLELKLKQLVQGVEVLVPIDTPFRTGDDIVLEITATDLGDLCVVQPTAEGPRDLTGVGCPQQWLELRPGLPTRVPDGEPLELYDSPGKELIEICFRPKTPGTTASPTSADPLVDIIFRTPPLKGTSVAPYSLIVLADAQEREIRFSIDLRHTTPAP